LREVVDEHSVKGLKDHEKVFFVLNDAIVLDPKSASVFSELANRKFE
jgi:hypothetical protein